MRLIIVGDPHFRGRASRYRIDDYYAAQFDKLDQIMRLAKQHTVDGVVFLGDVMHSPRESYQLTTDLILKIQQSPCKVYSIVGNHDLVGYQIDTLPNSPLGVLTAAGAVELLDESGKEFLDAGVVIRGIPYKINHTPQDYQFASPELFRIVATHNMIVPLKDAPFAYTHPDQVETNAHLVLCGHYHHPFDYTNNKNLERTRFINPGIPMRWTLSESTMQPKVALLTVDNHQYQVKYFTLQHTPAPQAFDFATPKKQEEQRKSIDEFVKVLKTTEFSSVNLEETIIQYGQTHNIDPQVLAEVLDRVQKQRVL